MKKLTLFGLSALLLVAFISSPALAGPGCSAHKISADKAKGAECNYMTADKCLKLYGMTPEECKKMCADHENCGFTKISVKGMTCGGCESQVTSALSKVDGVNKVIKVDHKEGYALVCADPTKVDKKVLTAAVINTGYQAEIIPAVARTDGPVAKTLTASGKAGRSKTCGSKANFGSKTCAKTGVSQAKAGGCPSSKTADNTDKTDQKSDES